MAGKVTLLLGYGIELDIYPDETNRAGRQAPVDQAIIDAAIFGGHEARARNLADMAVAQNRVEAFAKALRDAAHDTTRGEDSRFAAGELLKAFMLRTQDPSALRRQYSKAEVELLIYESEDQRSMEEVVSGLAANARKYDCAAQYADWIADMARSASHVDEFRYSALDLFRGFLGEIPGLATSERIDRYRSGRDMAKNSGMAAAQLFFYTRILELVEGEHQVSAAAIRPAAAAVTARRPKGDLPQIPEDKITDQKQFHALVALLGRQTEREQGRAVAALSENARRHGCAGDYAVWIADRAVAKDNPDHSGTLQIFETFLKAIPQAAEAPALQRHAVAARDKADDFSHYHHARVAERVEAYIEIAAQAKERALADASGERSDPDKAWLRKRTKVYVKAVCGSQGDKRVKTVARLVDFSRNLGVMGEAAYMLAIAATSSKTQNPKVHESARLGLKQFLHAPETKAHIPALLEQYAAAKPDDSDKVFWARRELREVLERHAAPTRPAKTGDATPAAIRTPKPE